ncbi:hypothetical protein [Streptomyces boncukensis]|uniref:Uncharacterized protein n=1 Tax=Streptomyces boncukensis TaxID=2711219 RepID=A0A6G4WR09_9ACTN|nr:hypothetical protein [Streptomyces boncukensis]NGO66994.1 hypothetical protein [Streptomyces boncukensis]
MVMASLPAKEDSPIVTPPHAHEHSFARRLNLLFEACAPEDPDNPGQYVEYTNQQVADEINRRHGRGTITGEYIRRMRKDGGPNPTERYMAVLADFFQVPLDAFKLTGTPSEIADKVMAEAQRFVEMKRRQREEERETPDIAVLARAARRLSPEGQARVARYVSKLQQIEQLENEADG